MHRIVKPQVHIYKVDKNKRQSFFDKVIEIRYHVTMKLLLLTCFMKFKYINILHYLG